MEEFLLGHGCGWLQLPNFFFQCLVQQYRLKMAPVVFFLLSMAGYVTQPAQLDTVANFGVLFRQRITGTVDMETASYSVR